MKDSHIMTVLTAMTPALLTQVWTKTTDHLYIWRDMKERDTVTPCFTGLCSEDKNLYNKN